MLKVWVIVVILWDNESVENWLNLFILDVMMLIYRSKLIVNLVNELVCDWTIVDLDWKGWECPKSKYRIV